jgi:serine/threonine protein kinase
MEKKKNHNRQRYVHTQSVTMEEEAPRPSGGAGARPEEIRTKGYAVPKPTWRVPAAFASWDIDHDRFEIKKQLGKGAYGIVAEAFDHLLGKRVAIKRILDIFDVFENSKRIYREVRAAGPPNRLVFTHSPLSGGVATWAQWARGLTATPPPPHPTPHAPPPLSPPHLPLQIKILRELHHPYVAKLLFVSCPGVHDRTVDLLNFRDLYIVFECVDTDMGKLVKDETQTLSEQHIK